MAGRLTATQVDRIQITKKELDKNPNQKVKKLSDGDGLYLYVYFAKKKWVYRKNSKGKKKDIAIGYYPVISLAEAREKTLLFNRLMAEGKDPVDYKKEEKAIATKGYSINCFQAIAEEWFERTKANNAESYKDKILHRLKKYIFPELGLMSMPSITINHLRKITDRILARGIKEEARRNINVIGEVFDYAINAGIVDNNPARNFIKCLPPRETKNHYAAIVDPEQLGDLLRVIYSYRGSNECVETLLKLAPYLFQRPGDMRNMKWADVDLRKKEWYLTTAKTATQITIPLPDQVVELLSKMYEITGSCAYVFISPNEANSPLSDNAIRAAYHSLGIDTKNVHTEHGWRATATTILDEVLLYPKRFIETQVGHKVPDANGRAYNRTRYREQRKIMLQAWADYLDELRTNLNPDYEALQKKYAYRGLED